MGFAILEQLVDVFLGMVLAALGLASYFVLHKWK
jgi:hypothetical protein